MSRPTWDQYFMQFAQLCATRSTCASRSVGAVLVLDRHILATGYNGNLPGQAHCIETECQLDADGRCSTVLHAEQNIILQCAKRGTSMSGATLYCTWRPCKRCSFMLAASGIKHIIYLEGTFDQETQEILAKQGVTTQKLPQGI